MTPAELLDLNGYRELPQPPTPDRVYKAAPRDGVWATPPFMHNGSVPDLYDKLIPASERPKKFCIGREFDPIKVGLDTTCGPGTFVMDTSLPGNSKAGHSFQDGPRGNGVIGPLLTDTQRWELVEYLNPFLRSLVASPRLAASLRATFPSRDARYHEGVIVSPDHAPGIL